MLFIFDMDDVLYHYDWQQRMRGMAALTGLSFDELRARWWHDAGERAAEAGAFTTGAAYLAAFEEAVGCTVDVGEWVRLRGDAMTPWPESLAAVRRASELGQITLLTNNNALAGEHLATLAPELVDLFGEHLLTTSFYGARKPDSAVFENVLEHYGARPEHAFFADDLVENVRGAESVGITGHLFTTGAEMHAAIDGFAEARR